MMKSLVALMKWDANDGKARMDCLPGMETTLGGGYSRWNLVSYTETAVWMDKRGDDADRNQISGRAKKKTRHKMR